MKGVKRMKLNLLCVATGLAGSVVAHLFGEYDMIFEALIVLMVLDYVSGFMVGFSNKSLKTEDGGLNSKVGFKGLCRKCMTLVFVIAAHYLDVILGVDYVRNAVVIGFCMNELISLVENAGLIGLPLPGALTRAIDLLKQKDGDTNEKDL